MKEYRDDWIEVTGTTYSTGGFPIEMKNLKKIKFAIVEVEYPDVNNLAFKHSVTVSDNVVKVKIETLDVTGTAPAWTELTNGADISGYKFRVYAKGY